MAQRKETKKKIRVRDLKPKRDAKGGLSPQAPRPNRPGRPSPDLMRPGRP
jgi:hypothetical protein